MKGSSSFLSISAKVIRNPFLGPFIQSDRLTRWTGQKPQTHCATVGQLLVRLLWFLNFTWSPGQEVTTPGNIMVNNCHTEYK